MSCLKHDSCKLDSYCKPPSSVNLVDPYVKKSSGEVFFFIHSLIFKTGNHDHTEIWVIWRPGAGLAGTRDIMAQIRDFSDNPGWVATLC